MRISDWSSDVCSSDLVLSARGREGQLLGQPHRREHLLLLGPQVSRVETDGLLHGGERHELQEVILDDVAGGADPVVIAGAAADADVLGHRDLHVVDVVAVPDRLVQLVRSEEHTSELQSLMRISYAVFCLQKKKTTTSTTHN